jgi:arylsulfatase A-like enzyme
MLGLAHRGFRLTEPSQHLATTLRDYGYRTILAGIQHVTTGDPSELGYETVLHSPGAECEEITENAIAAMRSHVEGSSGKPFFLDVGYFETHRPFPAAEPAASRYVQPPSPLPDTPETRQDIADYNLSVTRLDRALGRVLDALGQLGLAGTTLVIATTDHGIAFPRMKCNLTQHGTGVLLILRGPGVPTGAVTDALVSQIDIFPTICELTGTRVPTWLQGRSLVPVLEDTAAAVNEQIFSEVTYHAAYEPQRSIRTPRWTYIERFGDRRLPVLPNCDDGASRDLLLDNGWDEMEMEPRQLYDNIFDPAQGRNLVNDPRIADVAADLRERLHGWMERTGDPLRHGEVPLPAGASMNRIDSSSASEDLIIAREDGTHETMPNSGELR